MSGESDGGGGGLSSVCARKVGLHRSWRDVCGVGASSRPEPRHLHYISPVCKEGREVAVLEKAEVEEMSVRWKNSILLYVLGKRPYYLHLKAFLMRMWKPKGEFELFSRDNGFFLARFGCEEEISRVLEGGPWLFDGRLVVTKRWSSSSTLERDSLERIPIWVRLPDLAVHLWTSKVLSKILSIVGNPLFMDKATAEGKNLAFARCCVEVAASKELPDEVVMEVEGGGATSVRIAYDWKPPHCSRCEVFLHDLTTCPKSSDERGRQTGPQTGMAEGREVEKASPGNQRDPVMTESAKGREAEQVSLGDEEVNAPICESVHAKGASIGKDMANSQGIINTSHIGNSSVAVNGSIYPNTTARMHVNCNQRNDGERNSHATDMQVVENNSSGPVLQPVESEGSYVPCSTFNAINREGEPDKTGASSIDLNKQVGSKSGTMSEQNVRREKVDDGIFKEVTSNVKDGNGQKDKCGKDTISIVEGEIPFPKIIAVPNPLYEEQLRQLSKMTKQIGKKKGKR